MNFTTEGEMNMTTQEIDMAKAEALVGRLFSAAIATLDLSSVYLGERLGLYRSLAEKGAATAAELASRARIHPRYAREWLEQQAVTGLLDVDDPARPEDARRYSIDPSYVDVLVNRDSPFYIG